MPNYIHGIITIFVGGVPNKGQTHPSSRLMALPRQVGIVPADDEIVGNIIGVFKSLSTI